MHLAKPIAAALLAMAALALAAKSVSILVDLVPEPPKKAAAGYEVEGRVYHYRDKRLDARVAYLLPEDRAAWFSKRGLQDPFEGLIKPEDNYVFFCLRLENLQKEENVAFTPGSSMFGTANLVDDTTIYQMFYKENDGEARLAVAGKSFFFKALYLPPGQWIERLLLFQYDESYAMKKVPLVMSSILLGRDGIDLEFSFLATFKKEKRK